MTTRPTAPRSIYAGRLGEFPQLAFADHEAFAHRDRWREFFGARIGNAFDQRIIFEIGCSDGDFLSRIAAKFPTTAFIGLDWKFKSLHDAAARVTAMGLQNVALIRGRGQDIGRLFALREVDEIWVFHPDPCDRDVEMKNRLIAEPFLFDAHQVLRDGTSHVCLKTDHPGYYQWTLSLLGLPQPESFGSPCAASAPRVRTKGLMKPKDLPPSSEAIRERFAVPITSADYWNDAAALAQTLTRDFAGERTVYEARFARKRFPIYYVELQKK
jgi:tRNA G46 methylase TrmB